MSVMIGWALLALSGLLAAVVLGVAIERGYRDGCREPDGYGDQDGDDIGNFILCSAMAIGVSTLAYAARTLTLGGYQMLWGWADGWRLVIGLYPVLIAAVYLIWADHHSKRPEAREVGLIALVVAFVAAISWLIGAVVWPLITLVCLLCLVKQAVERIKPSMTPEHRMNSLKG